MKVKLLGHTQLSEEFLYQILEGENLPDSDGITDGSVVALSAIRTCYSHLKPSEVFEKEGHKYFDSEATDGEGGKESDRLFRTIIRSKHTSTMEHIAFNFSVEGVSRVLLAQLTRHRVGMSYSVQSQRYVRFGSKDRSGGAEFYTPPSIAKNLKAACVYNNVLNVAQVAYDELRALGIPAEDARMVFPSSACCNLVLSANLTAILAFYGKRKEGEGAQHEITQLADLIKEKVIEVEPWTAQFFK